MNPSFAELLRQLRTEKGFSQQQLGDALHVDRSTIAKWETGDRMPDAAMISLLSHYLDADVAELFRLSEKPQRKPIVLMVDDEKIILTGGMPVLKEVMPDAVIKGFTNPLEAVEFAKKEKVVLVFLDIEMGNISGLDICRELLTIDSRINVVFMTAFMEYSFEAWETGACGFLLKPPSAEEIKRTLRFLDHGYKFFFKLFFTVLIVYAVTDFLGQLSMFPGSAVAFLTKPAMFLEALFASFLMLILTMFLLYCSRADWKRSRV